MAFLVKTAASAAFKRLLGKAHTDNDRGIGNETVISGFNFNGADIYGEEISYNSPTTAQANSVCSALVTLTLEADDGSNGHAYFAKLPTEWVNPDSTRFLNKSGSPAAAGDYIKDTNISIISGAYGSSFSPIIYDNGTQVPPSDSSDWVFDTYAGILTQEGSDDGAIIDYGTTGTVACYFYIGKTILEKISTVSLKGVKSKVDSFTYSLTDYGIIGVLDDIVNETSSVSLDVYGGPVQEDEVDYSVIEVTAVGTTGLVVGYYIAILTNSVELLTTAGATVVGSNPSVGLSGILSSGDRVQVTYNISE